jgi:asparagine synthase (glutamine-hydrolysing)
MSSVLSSGVGRGAGSAIARALSGGGENEGRALRIRKALKLAGSQSVDDLYRKLVGLWPEAVNPLTQLKGNTVALPKWIGQHEQLDPVEQLMLYDLVLALPGDMLVKVDRAAMAHALETRVPFLDHEFIEVALSVPVSLKLQHGRGKWLLRTLLAKYAPHGWMEEPQAKAKIGFGVPINRWLRGELRDWAESLLSPERVRSSGALDPKALSYAWDGLQSGKIPCHHAMWSVLMFQAWIEEYKSFLRL